MLANKFRADRRGLTRKFLAAARKRGPVVQLDCGCYRFTCPSCGAVLGATFNPQTGRWQCDGQGLAEHKPAAPCPN